MRSAIVMCSHYRFADHGASCTSARPGKTGQERVDRSTGSFQTGAMTRSLVTLAVLVSLVVLHGPSLAGDLVSPRGAPWWLELAQCGGLALAVRDRAVDHRDPPERIAGLTRDMNAFLEAGTGQLRQDRGIEAAPAKRSVHLAAGRAWEVFKSSAASLGELEGKLAACAAELETYRRAVGNRQ
jgi:hypothetical protein